MVDIGVACGRFQVFHLKHLEYILAAKMHCRKLLIGIEDFDGSRRGADHPFTYYERFVMIQEALLDFGVRREEFEIVPFPLSYPERISNYIPEEAVFYLNICDAESERTMEILGNQNFHMEILMRKDYTEKGTTGGEIRNRIITGEEWRQLVPKTVYEYIRSHHLDDRILAYAGVNEEVKKEENPEEQVEEYLDGDEDIKLILD